jgi:enolase-phosphatase E1
VIVPLLDARAIVLDVEGTTTPVAFVYDVLFPYARDHAIEYLEREGSSDACRAAVTLLRNEQADDRARGESLPLDAARAFSPDAIAAYVGWLTDLDRKSRGLKTLQGLIWQDGYRAGALRGAVFDDVAPALERWHTRGLRLYIYSSGSVLAQRWLFQTTPVGDLTVFLDGHFDTAVGPKTSSDSYRAILREIGVEPAQVLFISDAQGELDAARVAGLRTVLCERPGNPSPAPRAHRPVIHTFDDVA